MKIRIGTRRSPLALAQADLLMRALKVECEIIEVITSGDKKQNLGEGIARDKKDWIFELEQALLDRKIDCAIHSAKDVPVQIAEGTNLLPVLKRESPNDLLISKKTIDLNQGSLKIGTSSLRRVAQLARFNHNLSIESLRGNVNTRLGKLDNDFDGIVLAQAGVSRLKIKDYQFTQLDLENFTPASNQGILACQFLDNNVAIAKLIRDLVDIDTNRAFEVERKLVEFLGADCHSAIGIYSDFSNDKQNLNVKVYSDHSNFLSCKKSVTVDQYQQLASIVADELITQGVKEYL